MLREHFKVKLARRTALRAANSCKILIFNSATNNNYLIIRRIGGSKQYRENKVC